MNNAVQWARDAKPVANAKKSTLNFANEDLRRVLRARARSGPIKVYFENECPIPLLDVKGGKGHDIDLLAKPVGKSDFDAIAKPAPIGPCPVWS